MKTSTLALRSVFLICLAASAVSAQQQFTHTVTAQSKNCNATCSVFDIPQLSNNPGAIIFITPVSGSSSNPHPIGAYYMYLSKWSVFNLDGVALPVGAKFNVEYYVNADASHFVYVVPQRVHPNDLAYIDHAGLNNNPNAQIRIFPTTSATVGNIYNPNDLKTQYDPTVSKWFVANVNGTAVSSSSAYNVMLSTSTVSRNPNANREINPGPSPLPGTSPGTPPTSNVPSGVAGGDLNGNYPNPKVIGLQGRPLSSGPPIIGQTLRWNGIEWAPSTDPPAEPVTATPPPTNSNATPAPTSYFAFLPSNFAWTPGTGGEVQLPSLSLQITLTRPSVVNVSAYVGLKLTTNCGVFACGPQGTGLRLYRNNAQVLEVEVLGENGIREHIFPNYPEQLGPGTYTYKLMLSRVMGQSEITVFGSNWFKSYLSVQVFPQ